MSRFGIQDIVWEQVSKSDTQRVYAVFLLSFYFSSSAYFFGMLYTRQTSVLKKNATAVVMDGITVLVWMSRQQRILENLLDIIIPFMNISISKILGKCTIESN